MCRRPGVREGRPGPCDAIQLRHPRPESALGSAIGHLHDPDLLAAQRRRIAKLVSWSGILDEAVARPEDLLTDDPPEEPRVRGVIPGWMTDPRSVARVAVRQPITVSTVNAEQVTVKGRGAAAPSRWLS